MPICFDNLDRSRAGSSACQQVSPSIYSRHHFGPPLGMLLTCAIFSGEAEMGKNRFVPSLLVSLAWLALLPAGAAAQSAFSGTVTDSSGAVLPGVTVEAGSPALIEGSRSAVTDGQGRYTIVQLRPGIYKLTFTLVGFATVVREGVELPSDFTMTINGQLSVGALQESVTVSGQAP